MKNRFWFLIFLSAVVGGPLPAQNLSARTEADFERTADEFLAGYLAWRPAVGTSLGLHEYDGKVTDYRRSSLDAELARLRRFEERLERVPTNLLGPRAHYDHRILLAAIRSEIFSFVDARSYARNPITYAEAVSVNIYIKRDFAPLPERVRSIIAIEREVPAMLAAARANLDALLPRPFVETALEVAGGSASFLGKDLVEALHDLSDRSLQDEFQAVNARAIAALRAYTEYLKTEKLPKAHNRYALGREKFQKMLRSGELISLSPERVLEIGLKELRREQETFAAAARLIDAAQKPIDVFRRIQKDHPGENTLIPETMKNLEAIRQFVVDHRIVTLPSEVRVRVEETPAYDRATSFASMDTPGPFETKATEAYYYVTPVEKDWTPQQKEEWLTAFNYYTTDVVSIHEAYPGHYTQNLCLNASSANRLEKIFSSYAFTEGWAHYAEQMLVDEGFGSSRSPPPTPAEKIRAAQYRLAQSDEALLRLCRLCVSIKTHCQGMSVDEATRFFQENCYYEAKPARQEAMRGTFDPGYLFYTLGKLQILKLREDWRKQEGAAFSLRRFHDELLRHGMPPLRLLREVMLKDKAIWDEIL